MAYTLAVRGWFCNVCRRPGGDVFVWSGVLSNSCRGALRHAVRRCPSSHSVLQPQACVYLRGTSMLSDFLKSMRLHALVTCIFIVFLVYRLHTVMYKCMYVYMYMQVIHVNSFQYLELRFRKPWLKTIGSVSYLLHMESIAHCVWSHFLSFFTSVKWPK